MSIQNQRAAMHAKRVGGVGAIGVNGGCLNEPYLTMVRKANLDAGI